MKLNEMKVNGMSLARYIASKLLENSSLRGEKYYRKEEQIADKISSALKYADQCKTNQD